MTQQNEVTFITNEDKPVWGFTADKGNVSVGNPSQRLQDFELYSSLGGWLTRSEFFEVLGNGQGDSAFIRYLSTCEGGYISYEEFKMIPPPPPPLY